MSEKLSYETLEKRVRELETSERYLQTVLTNTQDLICIAGLDGYLKYVNPAWEKVLGYSQSELIDRPFLSFIHPDDHAKNDDEVKQLSMGRETIDFQNRVIHKDGRIRAVSWTATPFPDEKLIYCIGQEITHQAVMEKQLLRSREGLAETISGRTLELQNEIICWEKKYRATLETALDGFWIIDAGGSFLEVNEAYSQLSGYSRAELLTMHIFDVQASENREEVIQYIEKILSNGSGSFESIHRKKNNTLVYVTINYRYLAVEGGIIVVFIKDISERKNAEAVLTESEQKFKKMFEQAPLSYQSLDLNGNFTEVNKTWLATMGYSYDEVYGKNFSEFLVPEWKDHFKENFPRFKAVGEVLGVEFEMVKKDGSIILVSFHGKIGKDPEGNFERTHCVFNDISIQKSAEETLKKDLELNKAIAAISKELLSEVYNIKKVSDITLQAARHLTGSEHGFVSSIDKNTLENVGHTLTEMFGRACRVEHQRIAFPVGDDGQYGGLWGHALNTKKAFFSNTPAMHPSSTGVPEGHISLRSYMAVPVLIGDKLLGLIALSNSETGYSESDINSVNRIAEIFALAIYRQEYEAERISMEQNLRQLQKNEAIGALAGGIAHDFNNILFPIIGFAELLEEDLDEDSPLQESVEEILIGAKRAKELVRQILTFSRQAEQTIKPLKPHVIINEVVKLMQSTIPKTIEIREAIDQKCRTIMADPTQIHQVAMNLVTNAYHAMQEVGGVLTISLDNIDIDERQSSLSLDIGPHIRLSVEDTGSGMDPGIIEKIFDPYFSTKPKDKGTGLGLSVVQGVVKNYGGDIELISIVGQGTVFHIYLPAFESSSVEDKISGSPQLSIGSETILLVDDEVSVLRFQQKMLQRLGYKVDVTDSSEDAFNIICPDWLNMI